MLELKWKILAFVSWKSTSTWKYQRYNVNDMRISTHLDGAYLSAKSYRAIIRKALTAYENLAIIMRRWKQTAETLRTLPHAIIIWYNTIIPYSDVVRWWTYHTHTTFSRELYEKTARRRYHWDFIIYSRVRARPSDNNFWRNFRTETVSEQYGYFKSANNSYFPPVAAAFPFNFSPINYLHRPSAARVFVRNKFPRIALYTLYIHIYIYKHTRFAILLLRRVVLCLKYYIM